MKSRAHPENKFVKAKLLGLRLASLRSCI
jgi:hypothetical protein